MPASEITFGLLDGGRAASRAAEAQALRAGAYAGLGVDPADGSARLAGRFATQCRQPGFALAEARSGGYLIGWAAGLPLRPSTSWWRELTTSLPEDFTDEHPGRTFALVELVVRAAWRRQRIGGALHDLLLTGRTEERATAVVPPGATAALAAFQSWGWQRIARARPARPGVPASEVLILALPGRG